MDEDDELDDELGISRMKRRTRRQYDERRDLDDMDGVEDVSTCIFAWHYKALMLLDRNYP